MKLSLFLLDHQEEIMSEWVSFARTLLPAAESMSEMALRDHGAGILLAIGKDIDTRQTPEQQQLKSQGQTSSRNASQSAAAIHGAERHAQGLSLLQLSAEYRALRATILRLWLPKVKELSMDTTNDMVRFNEAIDQALVESIITYSRHTVHTRDMFLAVLGHDLRAPLAGLGMAGIALVDDIQPEPVARIGVRVNKNVELMKIMVGDLIEFTRTQLGSGIPIKRNRADVGEIGHTALANAEAVKPDYKFELLAHGDLSGSFDSIRLHQLLTNLLVNAGQYGSKDHPITMNLQGEHDEVVVQVSNRGPVIDKNALRSIFKPLVQLPADQGTPSRPSSSMGLGLFIVEEIAIAHGGSVGVTSDAVDGTTFTVRLPRHAATL
ncbi:MAG: HAMP domain-containing histidine kinase [Polaromonas sp.]|nr:HAMP domain-containing histidine kinase [Polaromonas sp.]